MPNATQDVSGSVPLMGEAKGNSDDRERHQRRKCIGGVLLALAVIALIVGVLVGVTQDTEQEGTAKTIVSNNNPNIDIFDKALALIESTPRQFQDLPSGETISYREYNKGKAHVLVMLPGYICDDAAFSILAVLPEFKDHHIIAVNPRGWNGSSMNTPITSHEDNADEVMELLKAMNVKKAMVWGYSTGGGIAFYMAHKYSLIIKAAFLFHSIPLNGFKIFDENEEPVGAEAVATMFASAWPDDMARDTMIEQLKLYSANPAGLPPATHGITTHLAEAIKMPGKHEAMIANVNFNVSPIKTPFAETSDALASLSSKVIIIHGSKDTLVAADQVELLTKLAIAEHWAPPGMISFLDDGEGHMLFFDNPAVLASIYRGAFEEFALHSEGSI